MSHYETNLIKFRLADERSIIFKPRRSRNRRLLCADARMLAAFYKMRRQIRRSETTFNAWWRRQSWLLHRVLHDFGRWMFWMPGLAALSALIKHYRLPRILVL